MHIMQKLTYFFQFVSNSEKLVVLRLGRAQKTRGPGATLIVPCIDTTFKISTTITAFNVPPLQVITIDRGLVELGATVFLRIRDPVSAVCSIQDRNTSTRTLANTMLYRYISKRRICEITNGHDRRILAATLKDELGSFTATYGVEITDVEFSDVKVLKEGENMGLAALSAVVKSDAGVKLWEVIAPHVEEFAREVKEQAAAMQSKDPMDPAGPSPVSDITTETLVDIGSASRSAENLSIDEDRLITIINMAIDESLMKAVGCVYQIKCPEISSIVIDLKHPPGLCSRGTPAVNPDVIFEMSHDVFVMIIKQELSPITAYMQGAMKVYGPLQDALSLKYLAERVKHLL
ncbi:SPFH/Band 7/PHB domain protein [Cooperia oncophora]